MVNIAGLVCGLFIIVLVVAVLIFYTCKYRQKRIKDKKILMVFTEDTILTEKRESGVLLDS